MLTDTHCHLASHQFSPEEIPALIDHAREAGVSRLITLATGPTDLTPNLELAIQYPEIHACLGVHPCDVHEAPDDFEPLFQDQLNHNKVAAVGETGLDYFHPAPAGWSSDAFFARQREFLHRHFQLAARAELNIVLHTRDRSGQASFDDCLEIYSEYRDRVRAVFHCFPGPPENARRVVELGGLVSFTGIATFKNAHTVVETVKSLPLGSFMVETDAPYLAPVPHRGQRCEPAYARITAQHLADLQQVTLPDLAHELEKTTQSFFRLS